MKAVNNMLNAANEAIKGSKFMRDNSIDEISNTME